MNVDNTNELTFEEYPLEKIKRRSLLPWWIKVFCWIFMIIGILSLVGWIVNFVTGKPLYVGLFVNKMNTVELFSIWGSFLGVLTLFKAYVGYALWFEKANGVFLGRIDAIVSIFACVASIGISLFSSEMFSIRLELILLIPYLLKMNSIEYEWKYEERQI